MSLFSVIYSKKFLKHDTGFKHPENPGRLLSIVKYLKNSQISSKLNWIEPNKIDINQLLIIHTSEMIDNVQSICLNGGGLLDADTPVCSESFEIALYSAGAWLDGLNEVINGNPCFVLSRPPGHHAEKNKSMGFCIFSNAALTAVKALEIESINKVAIFDWDVHHGNGTENIVIVNPNILYSSIHQYPFYPGTGFSNESKINNNILNVPLASGTKWENYKVAFYEKIITEISNFSPDLIIISAGFDAHLNDPLASFELSSKNFGEMTTELLKIQPKALFGLEGGYNLKALTESVEIVIKKNIEFFKL
ncbi:MAG: hypothetical protein CMF96_08665 [Candidatus Marinimicrobia bacterium]|nr:hypothetical protein [Candidatus Neomarinimicrobiota bacterium]MAJ44794.1 hypothetical protein [Candidatus Neomarinimicrobiota bacterium]|tara:strand:+ start:5761 stop:6681 length:921 start_codon:yes stop_codon:yes gene_type:complete